MTTNEKYIEIEKKMPKNWYIDKILVQVITLVI